MKKILIVTLISLLFVQNSNAQTYDKNCYYGFTFEVSKNPNWGTNELVITSVEPNSPAEKAGIKVDDIIMEINGKATYLRDNQTIARWLFDEYNPEVKFTIRNLDTYFKEYTFTRKCIALNSVNEQQLSSVFSFYSLENTNEREFTLPVNIEVYNGIDFTDYHTFDFAKETGTVPPVDKYIKEVIERELTTKGLVRDTKDPDIIVQQYYSYVPNPQFTGLNDNPNYAPGTWRFSNEKQKMVYLPIFDQGKEDITKIGQFILEYGFSFYDRKYIDKSKLTQIWDCSIKDFLSANYSLEEYTKLHTPLMLMQFPYVQTKKNAKYIVSTNRYAYTGLYFDADDLVTIKDVDEDSPAYIAGIRPSYTIKKINNKPFNHTKESLSAGYKRFIVDTMGLRDTKTRFTNSEGYTDCMLWDVGYYPNIAREFEKPAYLTHFSYLYGFEKYVNNQTDDKVTIEAWDGMQLRIFNITPEIRQSVTIKTL